MSSSSSPISHFCTERSAEVATWLASQPWCHLSKRSCWLTATLCCDCGERRGRVKASSKQDLTSRNTSSDYPPTHTSSHRISTSRLVTYLPGLDQRSSAVHVILRVHDKHHLVSVKFESTVQTAGVLHSQLAVPLSPAAHRLHLPHLPATETTQVPRRSDTFVRPFHVGLFWEQLNLNWNISRLLVKFLKCNRIFPGSKEGNGENYASTEKENRTTTLNISMFTSAVSTCEWNSA